MELTQIPKIELHLHLDGAVPPETMWRMAQEKGLALPADTLEDFRTWLVRTADCRDVDTYLARFELPLQLMQDAPSIERITFDVLSTLARQGHVYDEVRFAPQLHTRQALCQQDAIEAVLAGRARVLRAFPDYRCGILLCCMCIGPETVVVSLQNGLGNDEVLAQLIANGQVATQYVDLDGQPTMDQRYNPNGSLMAIEGITSPDGRVFGKMGHSERSGEQLYKNVTGDKYQPIFEGGVNYFKL